MVLNKIKLKMSQWRQASIIFKTNEVPACDMRSDETFHNRIDIEIPVFDNPSDKNKKPDAILRGVLCKSIMRNSPTIIFAMGQNQNVEEARNYIPESLLHYFNLVLVNFRGYGIENGTTKQKSRGSEGVPSAKALEADIVRVYDYVKKHHKMKNFYAAGISLGSSLITYLSSQRKIEAQLLVTPFNTMAHQAHDLIKSVHKMKELTLEQVEGILDHNFNSNANMAKNNTKTSIIRAGNDQVVKKHFTDDLVTHIKNLSSDVTIEYAPHNFESPNPYVMSALRTAIGTVFRNFMIDCTERNRV
ncbi:MAG: putative alpha/beta-fold hydrolase [Alphaproteobacteria bacterium]|jgi:predicted alpha/beta-fold hydrolase